ncbi:hypothetical protein shim_32360 [Shimia sp. SK013]|nr:hypothetical protein shim_32360 [Shimia sp. SK013]
MGNVPDFFPGVIVKHDKTYRFTVKKCPDKHAGRGRALINYKRRDGTKRFQIVRLTAPEGLTAYAAVVGHYDDESIIKLDYDLRKHLNLKAEQEALIEVVKCGPISILYWYLTVSDPLIRVSACLALVSLALGVVSIVIAIT